GSIARHIVSPIIHGDCSLNRALDSAILELDEVLCDPRPHASPEVLHPLRQRAPPFPQFELTVFYTSGSDIRTQRKLCSIPTCHPSNSATAVRSRIVDYLRLTPLFRLHVVYAATTPGLPTSTIT